MNVGVTDCITRLAQVADRWLPRLLTQVCRDPASPHCGCFDRDWWHYRIRDFPSIILQQGGYALYAVAQLRAYAPMRAELLRLGAAAARFWNRRACRRGAFEEYYPWEQGYPPLAFSTLAVMKLAAQGVVSTAEIRAGAAVASRQLLSRFEAQAANQQVAGLAALAWCHRLFPEQVPAEGFAVLAERTLALQTPEGWFQEYGGPDLGYLSVTLDCLWDLFDATGERRFVESIECAVDCIAVLTAATPGSSIGMHNARNTDYLVPYGLLRAALECPTQAGTAAALVTQLYADADASNHFLAVVDDRYVCHYTGQSLMRALWLAERNSLSRLDTAIVPVPCFERLTQSGHFLQVNGQESLVVTLRKGGILTYHSGGAVASDFGWIIETDGQQFITHWWSDDWCFSQEGGRLVVEGPAYEHRETSSGPLQHVILRALSFTFGRRLIAALKDRLIFRKLASPIRFRRVIHLEEDKLRLEDMLTGLPPEARLTPAPRSSKRHVASADSYHIEDILPARGFQIQREIRREAGDAYVTTTFEKV